MSDGDPAPAPLPLRWVEELVNTRSVELGTDDVATPGDLAVVVAGAGPPPAGRAGDAGGARPRPAAARGATGADRRQQRR